MKTKWEMPSNKDITESIGDHIALEDKTGYVSKFEARRKHASRLKWYIWALVIILIGIFLTNQITYAQVQKSAEVKAHYDIIRYSNTH